MRSLLWVRAASAAALDQALRSGADALIVDLQEEQDRPSSVDTRHRARDFLRAAQFETHRPLVYVRLAGIEAATIDEDLAAVMLGEPDGLMLGRCHSGRDVQHLGAKLAVHEAEYGLAEGEGSIIAEAGAAALSIFGLGSYGDCSPRLMALAWDPDAFVADLGGEVFRRPENHHPAPQATARAMTLIGARAASVAAIDGASVGDGDAFEAECVAARRDGFNAKIALSADQVATINGVFDRGQ